MHEREMQVFIDSVTNYFEQMTDQPASVNTPYLMRNREALAYDYTGAISISGRYRGRVYFTAPRALLRHLLLSIGEPDTSHESLLDLVGEVANTISGNARKHFGREFLISVPGVIDRDDKADLDLPEDLRSFIIPVAWRSYEAAVVIGLE